jgi:predicted GNAT superfamily acetyltransferase
MLAVLEEHQGKGLGRHLKLSQREVALNQDIDLIVWTFDPLQARNAHFNVNTLGAIVRTYEVNFYGSGSSSPLHQGLATDRLLAEWWLSSNRVTERLSGNVEHPGRPEASVLIPSDIQSLKQQDLDAAIEWQQRTRTQFQSRFASGLLVGGFAPSGDGHTHQYLLYGPDHEIDPNRPY